MYLNELQQNWNTYGKEDPLWAIASHPEKQGNRWDINDFFKTGEEHVNRLIQWMDEHNLPEKRGTALDFGCGVGRLTQAICNHFKLGIGVDIAPSMIAQAKEYNKHGKNCIYRLNEASDLSTFSNNTFDFVHSVHVLQHINPAIGLRYVAEFMRVLKPGGLAIFHCHSEPATFAYPEEGAACTLETDIKSLSMEFTKKATVPVRVTNTGNKTLGIGDAVNAPVRIMHHWSCLRTGKLHTQQGYRHVTPELFEPGQTIEIDYPVATPPSAGKYILILEVCGMRGVTFAKDETDYTLIGVEATPRQTVANETGGDESFATKRPRIEMHVIPTETMIHTVESMNGRMVDIKSGKRRPGSVVASTYYATK